MSATDEIRLQLIGTHDSVRTIAATHGVTPGVVRGILNESRHLMPQHRHATKENSR